MKPKLPIILPVGIVLTVILAVLVLIGLFTQNDLVRSGVPGARNMKFEIALGFVSLSIILLLVILFSARANIAIRKKAEEALIKLHNETEQKVAEQAEAKEKLMNGEKQFRYTFDHMLEGVQIHDFNWRFIYVNDTSVKYSPYSKEELLGHTLMEKYPGIEQTDLFKVLQRCMNERVIEHLQTEFVFPDGSKADYELSIQPVPEGIFILSIDITERKRIQEELIQSEQKYHTIFLKSPLPKWVYDSETLEFLDVNEAAIRHYGYTREEFLNMTIKDIRPKEAIESLLNDILKIPEGLDYRQGTWEHLKKNGELIIVETTAHSVDFNNRKVRLVIINDITEKIAAEKQLQSAYDRLAFHMENTPLGFIEWDNQLFVKHLSKQAEDIFGWTEKEYINSGKSGFSQVYEEDLTFVEKIIDQLVTGDMDRNSVQHRNYTKDGRVIWCEWFNSVLKDKDGKVITLLSLVQDITERKKAEEALRQSELRLNEAQAIAHISNWEIDLLQDTHTWSDEFYRIFGINKAEVQPSTELFLSFMHPEDAGFAQKKVQEAFDSLQDSSFDFRFIRTDGITRHGHSEWKFEFDKKGNPVRLFGIFQDITERKEAAENLKILEHRILEQKIEAQKKIARAIITGQEKERNYIGQELHDNINQILAGTKMYLSIAGKQNETVKESVKYPIELIDMSIEEIRLLCRKLVTPVKNIDLEELLHDLLGKLDQDKIIKTVFTYTVPGELLSDDLKLNIYRIIQEMVNNILKYAEAKNVSISVKTQGKTICIMVEDDGRGFNVNSKRNGIGISNIINRAETFNGKVKIKSSPGHGCKAVVTIPC